MVSKDLYLGLNPYLPYSLRALWRKDQRVETASNPDKVLIAIVLELHLHNIASLIMVTNVKQLKKKGTSLLERSCFCSYEKA